MKTLKENWKNHEFSRCYLFFGEETYLIREYEAALRKAILPDGAEMMNEDSFEEKRATAAAIMDAAAPTLKLALKVRKNSVQP